MKRRAVLLALLLVIGALPALADAADYDLDDPRTGGCGHTLESCTCPDGHCGIEMP